MPEDYEVHNLIIEAMNDVAKKIPGVVIKTNVLCRGLPPQGPEVHNLHAGPECIYYINHGGNHSYEDMEPAVENQPVEYSSLDEEAQEEYDSIQKIGKEWVECDEILNEACTQWKGTTFYELKPGPSTFGSMVMARLAEAGYIIVRAEDVE